MYSPRNTSAYGRKNSLVPTTNFSLHLAMTLGKLVAL